MSILADDIDPQPTSVDSVSAPEDRLYAVSTGADSRLILGRREVPRLPARGRDAELAALGVRLDRVRSGVGAVVLVQGDAGMGKSRLLAEAAQIAGRLSFRVGTGTADPSHSIFELAPLMAAMFDGAEPLLDRPGLRAERTSPEQQYWLLQDLQALLERAALERPLLVCLDDMQWADSGTAAALRTLPGRLAALPVAWLVAYRPSDPSLPLSAALASLERDGAEKIVLNSLDDAAVAQVTIDVMGAEPDDALVELVRQARGSPFLLMEFLCGLREEGLVRVESGRAELLDNRPPRRVQDSMRDRMRQMPEPVRKAAIVAASLDRRFRFVDLATMLGQPPVELLSPIDELITGQILVEIDDRLAFRHDILRDAARASVPASARRALDRQAADVLLAAGATPVEVATQLAVSADPGDDVAIDILRRAVERR
jgi:predicted ATPase